MNKILIMFSFILFAFIQLTAQSNLVLNPSLENHYDTTEIGIASFLRLFVTDWSDPNDGSSDYFLPNSYLESSTPPNTFIGFEYPHSGYCFGGFIVYESPSHLSYEYVQAGFSSPLVSGQTYALETYVSLSEYSMCVSDLGFYFSDTLVYFRLSGSRLPLIPQYTNPVMNMITTKSGWQRIAGSYTAHGGESYLSIGNFLPYASSHTDTCYTPSYPFSYLFLDDLAVYDTSRVDTIHLCMNDSIELGGVWRKSEGFYTDMIGGLPVRFYLAPRPFSTNLTIIEKPFAAGDSVRISLLQKGGIDSSGFAINVNFLYVKSDTTIDIPMYNIYGCDSTVRYRCGTNIGLGKELNNQFDWDVYPNPANEFIEIKLRSNDLSSYSVSIWDISGKELYHQALQQNKIDVTTLNSGMYFVKLLNIKTGNVVGVKKFVKE